jgi:hypothetical protein
MPVEILTERVHRATGNSVVIDDDGRVCYGYIREPEGRTRFVGDVWIYNRLPAPKDPEWPDFRKAPFLNPQAYVVEAPPYALPTTDDDLDVLFSNDGSRAAIYISRILAAVVAIGEKPGWSAMAKRDGPVAKTLVESALEWMRDVR